MTRTIAPPDEPWLARLPVETRADLWQLVSEGDYVIASHPGRLLLWYIDEELVHTGEDAPEGWPW